MKLRNFFVRGYKPLRSPKFATATELEARQIMARNRLVASRKQVDLDPHAKRWHERVDWWLPNG